MVERGQSYHSRARLESAGLIRRQISMQSELESSQVVVCVRVRPVNAREAGDAGCLAVTSSSSLRCEDRNYTVDAVLSDAASQQQVFDLTARNVLDKVLKGFNGCVFAYGQTGSGKTFSMLGGDDGEATAGIIPRSCAELFDSTRADRTRTYLIKGTFLEVYQERLRDLLAPQISTELPGGSRRNNNLQIRHDKALGGKGIYVTGVRERLLSGVEDVLALLKEGTQRRVVGTTNMNAHSSRSHAVLSLIVSSQDIDDNEGFTRRVAKFHMVDLAGSERAKATGATGDRLKEGASINTSLSALGNVVNALTAKGSRGHIPYRDSKLTRLLQDSLGGNAFTCMLCCVSPAKMNAPETASSLRFAVRTKQIENKAVVNRDPKLARIADLTEENAKLKKELERLTEEVEKWKRAAEEVRREWEEEGKAEKKMKKKPSAVVAPESADAGPAGANGATEKQGKCCVVC